MPGVEKPDYSGKSKSLGKTGNRGSRVGLGPRMAGSDIGKPENRGKPKAKSFGNTKIRGSRVGTRVHSSPRIGSVWGIETRVAEEIHVQNKPKPKTALG